MNFLTKIFRQYWLFRRREIFSRWKRTLSFGDYVVDRWEKATELGFGEGASIYDSSIVIGDVSVGKNTWIGPFVVLDGSGEGLEIGSNCSISSGVQIYTHDTVKWATSGGKENYEYSSTKIGNNCYIGPNTIITKGVSLGEGCIVGANSLVTNSFEAGSKIAGSPAKMIGNT
tara:strand:+ start:535 stop:1050 length:516 start_codon:yes stop_codon:yes gene_type:complete